MNKSQRIRELADRGFSRAQIATEVGVRYQFVFNVLKKANLSPTNAMKQPETIEKEIGLSLAPISDLIGKGFEHLGEWKIDGDDGIILSATAPSKPGVYAFALDGNVVYVGVSARNLRQRLYHYSKPGPRQRTSIRIKALILDHLKRAQTVSVSIIHPERVVWNEVDLPMDTAVEAGLIKMLRPQWNKMGL